MYLKHFRVRNFMVHQDTDIGLPPLLVFLVETPRPKQGK